MNLENGQIYEFGDFHVDAAQRILSRGGEALKLSPKTFDLLLTLIENGNRVMSKEQLMRAIWADAFVEEANLTVHISALRKILDSENGKYIETIPKRGYRFIAAVREVAAGQTIDRINSPLEVDVGEFKNEKLSPFGDTNAANLDSAASSENTVRYKPALFADSEAENAAVENVAPDTRSAEAPRQNKIFVFAAALLLLIFAIAAFTFYKFSAARQSFQTMKIERVLETSKTVEAAIAPDGKYLAHVVRESGKQSLHVKHIATNSAVQLVAPVAASFSPLTFSADGNYIYYVLTESNQPGALFQIPVLGGEPKKILENVGGAISFAPNGKRFAFVRRVAPDETALMIADSAGGEPRQIAARRRPEYFNPNGAAWSPDGETIAIPGGSASGERLSNIFAVAVETGAVKTVSARKWRAIERAVWLKDGSALIAPAMDVNGQEAFQIWEFPISGAAPRRITNDLHDYGGISLTADEKTLATMRFEIRRNIWVVPDLQTKEAKLLTEGTNDSFRFVAWTPDKKIIYPSLASGTRDIWTMDAGGGNRKQLTATEHNDILPASGGDGRFIVFASNRAATGTVNVWRMNADGSNLVQLTFGADESQPSVSPDGKWVIYTAGGNDAESEKRSLWKVSIDGGEPVRLIAEPSFGADISPDGARVACRYKTAEGWKTAVIDSEGGAPIKFLEIPPGSPLRWSADGAAITYIKTQDGVSNVWSQPLSGEPPVQLTDFTTEQIYFFDWSSDNRLVCSRGITMQEAVLISHFK